MAIPAKILLRKRSFPSSLLLRSQTDPDLSLSVDQALLSRYACTRFQRFDNNVMNNNNITDNKTTTATATDTASIPNPTVVQAALDALEVARRAPSGFNAQPYKLLVISSPKEKETLAKYCIGHNAHRVRDSDCTVLFLADRQTIRTLGRYRTDILFRKSASKWKGRENKWALFKIQLLVAMFSQGLPFPYFMSAPISWAFRLAMRVLSWMTSLSKVVVLPTLTSAETWSQKNTMLVAMSYLLACTSRGIATCPMEGYLTWGIRNAFRIPRRYTIPLIVATGTPYRRKQQQQIQHLNDENDDAGMTHGATPETATLRYPSEQMIVFLENNSFVKTLSPPTAAGTAR